MLAVIGGTGVYRLVERGEELETMVINTPYGESPQITRFMMDDTQLFFMPRHHEDHDNPPHRINYRANLCALKQLGVKRILATNAVGSLDEKLEPGTFLAAVLLAPPFGLGVAALGALATLVAAARTKRPASRWGFGGWRLLLCPAVVVSGLGLVIARQEAARIPPERRTAFATTRAIRTSTDVGRLLAWARSGRPHGPRHTR